MFSQGILALKKKSLKFADFIHVGCSLFSNPAFKPTLKRGNYQHNKFAAEQYYINVICNHLYKNIWKNSSQFPKPKYPNCFFSPKMEEANVTNWQMNFLLSNQHIY